jgi:hypothetical protein
MLKTTVPIIFAGFLRMFTLVSELGCTTVVGRGKIRQMKMIHSGLQLKYLLIDKTVGKPSRL